MPRPVRLRPVESVRNERAEARRRWLAEWKQWAIEQLPTAAPRDMKVQIRAAVERALRSFGPEDDREEVLDIVTTIAEEMLRRLKAAADRAAHKAQKEEVLRLAALLVRSALAKFPRQQTAEMLNRPGYSLQALTVRLRRRLDRDLTGKESLEEIQARVTAWVEARLAEQPPGSKGVGRKVVVAAALGVGLLALERPALRDAALRRLFEAHDKARQWIRQWMPPPPAPPPDTSHDKRPRERRQ